MFFVYILRNIKTKKLSIGLTDDFNGEFKNEPKSVLVSLKIFKDKKEAGKLEKYLKSEKGLTELKARIKKKALGVLG